MAKAPSIKSLTVKSLVGTDRTVYASWSCYDAAKHTDKFEFEWQYQVRSDAAPKKDDKTAYPGVKDTWFSGSTGTVDYSNYAEAKKGKKGGKTKTVAYLYNTSYNYPENAVQLRFLIRPVAKTHSVKENNKSVTKPYYPKCDRTSSGKHKLTNDYPDKPAVPSYDWADMAKTKIRFYVDVTDSKTASITFELKEITSNSTYKTVKATVIAARASSDTVSLAPGKKYRVCCRSNNSTDKLHSDWTDYSDVITTAPATMMSKPSVKAVTSTSIEVKWTAVPNASSYTIEYTTDQKYFDTSPGQVQSDEIDVGTVYYATGLGTETDHEYYFRIRSNVGEVHSGWSPIASCPIGKKPAAPTTWSSSTVCSVGDTVYLYWTHNSQDNSRETNAQIVISRNNTVIATFDETNPYLNKEDEDTGTYRKAIKLDKIGSTVINDDTKLKWKVRTQGALTTEDDWSPYSTEREIQVYVEPTLSMTMGSENRWYWDEFEFSDENSIYTSYGDLIPLEKDDDDQYVLKKLPLFVHLTSDPASQTPITYTVSIYAKEQYEDVDPITGARIFVAEGSEVFYRYIDTSSHDVLLYVPPSEISLHDSSSYTIKASVSMDSGLNAEEETIFVVDWERDGENYEIDMFGVYDEETTAVYLNPECREVIYESGYEDLEPGDEDLPDDGEIEIESDDLALNVVLNVYRREADGHFTEISTNIANTGYVTVVDPHPTLGYANYRVTVIDQTNGKVYFEDTEPVPVPETSIIIQWDEQWRDFSMGTVTEDSLVDNPISGSILRLPFNINVQDATNVDVSFVNYIGRRHPVSYYGTHIGETATLSCEIDATDKDRIFLLRRLASWMGDCYVREPSGLGYWAQVKPSFNLEHCKLTVPVTLAITRVEGGA